MLGEIAPLQRGFDLPNQDIIEGDVPIVYSNGISKFHNQSKSQAPGLVTGRSGTIGKFTFIEKGEYWPHNTSLWVTDFCSNHPLFIYYLYQTINIEQFSTGSGVPTLNRNDVHNRTCSIPAVDEQQKISSFLSLIDERISTQNKIIEELETLKVNISKKVFSQELQFKEETKKWKEVRLDRIATFFSGGTPLTSKREFFEGDIPFIRSGEINSYQTEQFISELGLKKSSAKMVEVGDVLYALYGATSGEVGISKIKGAINQAILCIRSLENNYFIYSYLLYKKESIIATYLQGGQGNLSAEIVKQIKIPLPPITIQNKVATIFMSIDNKIKVEKQILNSLSKQKKYLLQQMFT